MEKSKAGAKERSPDSLSLPNQNTILINIKCYYCKRYEKNNEIQQTKNKMVLNNRKMTNHPPSPENSERIPYAAHCKIVTWLQWHGKF